MSSNAQFKSLSISLYRDIPQTDQISSPFHIKFVGDTQNQCKIYPVLDLTLLQFCMLWLEGDA